MCEFSAADCQGAFLVAPSSHYRRPVLLPLPSGGAPESTVRTTPFEVQETAQYSLPLMTMYCVEHVPEMLLADRMVKVCPTVGVKPLIIR